MSIADKLTQAAENVELVYQAGQDAGKEEAYDLFWDTFQKNGTRGDYTYAFYYQYWTPETFRPKYDLIVTMGTGMFNRFNQYKPIFDLAQCLEDLGITFDLSGASTFTSIFADSNVSRIPTVDTTSNVTLSSVFARSKATTIDKLILKADGSQSGYQTFDNMPNLENIVIEGVLGNSAANLGASTKLSKASITSFINALSATKTGQSITFSLTAVNSAFTDGSTGTEWAELIATKPNWTISLI